MTRRKSTVAAFVLLVLLVLPLAADQKPSFVFGGKSTWPGLSLAALHVAVNSEKATRPNTERVFS